MNKDNPELVAQYVATVASKLKTGQAREHAYRPAFESLIKSLDSSLQVVNDPSRSEHGNPDFVFLRGDITSGYAETKDIGIDLDKTEKTQQMERYLGYSNLILTDYLEFRFFRNGERYGEAIVIGELIDGAVKINEENFGALADTLKDFIQGEPEPIKSGKRLARIMSGKARRIRDNVIRFLASDSDKNSGLEQIYEAIKEMLVHDLSNEKFADMYAQTLVYGLFVARFHDDTPSDFTRQEARDLVPASNPFLRHFFDHIVGPDFDKRLGYIVDELCAIFSCADVQELMKVYFKKDLWGEIHRGPDPVIHFYEDFLKEYDADLRKKMGAYYTPLPVVQFIVRCIDDLLEREFSLTDGLTDTSKTASGVHRVQVLDPAVGTGTFISAVIGVIYARLLKSDQKGRWPTYVHNDLLPRLHGFELMMAPYTIAHLKLTMAFRKTGFKHFNRRLGIYLTNSLEESAVQKSLPLGFGLAESIAEESKEASVIKNKTPIMVVLGNPPYSGESSNAQYSGNDVYKFEPAGGKLQEKNSKWLNDDYVKFIRLAESMVEKTGEGIVAMITAHGYIDNPTFRGMRWHLMKTFDEIYVLDLHGNTNKKEKAPDGSEDQNVFNIKTGVAIFVGIKKKGTKPNIAKIFHADLYGKQSSKFEYLEKNSISSVKWSEITPIASKYAWIEKDEKKLEEYNQGFSVNELFPISSIGIVTSRDSFVIAKGKKTLSDRIQSFLRCQTSQEAKARFKLRKNKGWKIADALKHEFYKNNIVPISYRPFDDRYIYYHDDFIERSRKEVMKHFLKKENLGLLIKRQGKLDFSYIFSAKNLAESCMFESAYANNTVCPLYVYHDDEHKTPNLNQDIVGKIENVVGKSDPEQVFDYIYAVLHSPSYRKKYKEFLKIDFPRVSYPKDTEQFHALVDLGRELRLLHLLESLKVNQFITTYPIDGSNVVEKPEYKNDNVYINKEQYFGNVPEIAWNFWIGGYQPAQKWLKDRKGRELSNADIEHYQKIVVALVETDRLMRKIDQVKPD